MPAPTFSVITATYNEAENIEEYIRRVEWALRGFDFELVIVDDNSPDGTAPLARAVGDEFGNVRVIVRPRRQGLSSALLCGVLASRGEYVVIMDSDLQHPPEVLPELLVALTEWGFDLVVASRYVKGGLIVGWSPFRMLVSRVAIAMAHFLIPETRSVRDPVSGFFAVRRSVIMSSIRELSARGFKLLLEVLVKCPWSRVLELPYTFYCRRRGSSKLSAREVGEYLLQVASLAFSRRGRRGVSRYERARESSTYRRSVARAIASRE